jgi:hypothetical protein
MCIPTQQGAEMSTIVKLCHAINTARGLEYPAVGYLYFGDVKGDGHSRRRVWQVINRDGGIVATHNGKTYRETAANLRQILNTIEETA